MTSLAIFSQQEKAVCVIYCVIAEKIVRSCSYDLVMRTEKRDTGLGIL